MSATLNPESPGKACQGGPDHQMTCHEKERQNAIYSHVYKLPDDVLTEVFLIGTTVQGLYPTSDLCFSFKMSWVSSRWRRVAVNTPSLWTAFKTTMPATIRDLEKCTTLLSRTHASSRSLDISLTLCANVIRDELLPSDGDLLNYPDTLARCGRLLLSSKGSPSYYAVRFKTPAFYFTSLFDLRLSRVAFQDLSHFLDLLLASPNLVRLVLHGIRINHFDPTETRVITLDKIALLSLSRVYVRSTGEMHPLLARIHMPVLSRLVIRNWDSAFERPELPFSSVTSLSISFSSTTPEDERDVLEEPDERIPGWLIHLICGMPRLQTLELQDMDMGCYMPDFPSDISLPPLVNIDLGFSFNLDDLARFLAERTCGTLKTVFAVRAIVINDDGWDCCVSPSTKRWMQSKGIAFRFRRA